MTQDHSEERDTGNARYRSYLLRLWREGPGKGERVLLQDVLGGEPRCFSSLEGLFLYLRASRGWLESETNTDPSQSSQTAAQDSKRKGGSL